MIVMLDEIVFKTKERVMELKRKKPLEELKKEVSVMDISHDFPFKKALKDSPIAVIAEVKRASPSKGMIAEDFDYLSIAKEYEKSGASAVSVLTEPFFFKGSDDYLKEIAEGISLPVLRKDFIIDEYMIWQSKLLGASAVLLIASILSTVELKTYLDLAHELGLSAIVEAHDADEIRRAMIVGAEIVGVNNRNLNDFSVNIENSISLRRCVSGDVVFVSESGIKTAQDVRKLKENNVDAVLIGETLMKCNDRKAMISELKYG